MNRRSIKYHLLMLLLLITVKSMAQSGANFIPSSASNQLEMWQKETFDPKTIDKELGWAQEIGMTMMRVYLHHVAWQQDPKGFKERLNEYLGIAERHHIKTIFVFFDDCWKDSYQAGKQPEPILSVHNSQWLKDPGSRIDREPKLMDTLEVYVKDVMRVFGRDNRIMLWDLYNEPGHFKHGDKSWPLLKNVVKWARSVNAVQPVTIGLWNPEFKAFNKFQIENSDVITFHNYRDTSALKQALDTLTGRGKQVICTEYMKRPEGSTFKDCLPIFKRYQTAAINWGLVAGRSQTNYPQGNKGGEPEPELWYHDIFRKDGSPFNKEEIKIIKAYNKTAVIDDGPYVFYKNGKNFIYRIVNNKVTTISDQKNFKVTFKEPGKDFEVKLQGELKTGPVDYPMPEKLFVLSDIEGEFNAFRSLLLASHIIDEQYNWTFGKGHLVICGDLFDRGLQVPEYIWLLYSLEQKAKAKGGYVHVVLGNHDVMNLSGDFRYVQPKYLESAKLMGMDYKDFYAKDTELGRWLRSKNTLEKIGGLLFLHGGISPEINKQKWTLEQINVLARPYYDQKKAMVPDSLKVLFAKDALFWYRGYFVEPKITHAQLQETLDHFKAKRIVVGHTIVADTVSTHFDGKVIAVDVNEHEGKSNALLIEGQKYYRVNERGEKQLLLEDKK